MKRILSFFLLPVLFLAACKKAGQTDGGDARKKLTIALLPKSKGNQYFVNVEKGAREAANELGVELLFGVDAIAAACENKEGISTALKKPQAKGIKVVTYDSDANPDARSFFVNQATAEGIGNTLMDEAARLTGEQGEFAIITATLTAANMNEWRKRIEARLAAKYPKMKLVDTKPCDDQKDKAEQEAANLLSAYPNLKCIMAICSPAVPGTAEAVKKAGKVGAVKVLGLGLPSENRAYVHDGVTQSVILWKVQDLGYLTIKATVDAAIGKLNPGATEYEAGRLGAIKIEGDNIVLGQPFIFTKENIDQFEF